MVKANGARSLQDLVDEKANLVEYFYNDTLAPHYRARTGLTAAFIPPEFTNWRDEQRAWRETAILFDQSHHMPELMLKGPDAFRLLEKLGINSLANFTIDRAKQFVACTPRGHVIGDCVVYRLAEETFELISGMPVLNWVQFNAEQGGYDVTIERDDPTPYNPTGRRWFYRFQLEGPNAGLIFNAAVEGGAPEIAFFRTAKVKIGGCEVLVLRHGMAGHLGAELSGPYEEMEKVRAALIRAGEGHGLKQGGTKTYFSTIFEFGWMPYPCRAFIRGKNCAIFANGCLETVGKRTPNSAAASSRIISKTTTSPRGISATAIFSSSIMTSSGAKPWKPCPWRSGAKRSRWYGTAMTLRQSLRLASETGHDTRL